MQELRTEAKVENLEKVLDFLNGQLESLECPMKTQMQIDVALEELYVNIANYAYAPGTGDAVIQFDSDAESRCVTIILTDSGTPFDPLAKSDPDVSLPAEKRRIGGLGIYMAKKNMDDMQYRRENGKNILTLRKSLVPKPR